jgi:hypothetical protein
VVNPAEGAVRKNVSLRKKANAVEVDFAPEVAGERWHWWLPLGRGSEVNDFVLPWIERCQAFVTAEFYVGLLSPNNTSGGNVTTSGESKTRDRLGGEGAARD